MNARISYWDDGGTAGDTAPAPLPPSCDVAIIGAGFAGLSTCLALLDAKPGTDIVVLEAGRVGSGASGRAGGMVLAYPTITPWLVGGSARGADDWGLRYLQRAVGRVVDELRAAIPEAAPRPAHFVLIAPRAFARRGLDWLRERSERLGIAATPLDADAVAARTGSVARRGLAFGAHAVQPYALATALADLARRRGARIVERTRVDGIAASDDGIELQTSNGMLRAGHVVVCTNAYTAPLGLRLLRAAYPVYSYQLATEPLDAATLARLGDASTLVAVAQAGFSYRRVHDGRLLFGGLDRVGAAPGDTMPDDADAQRALTQLLARDLPWLADVRVERRWSGAFHATANGVPLIGAAQGLPGVTLNVGYAGAGISLALLSGALMRGAVFGPAYDDPEAARLRDAYAATRVSIRRMLGLALRLALRR